MITTSATDMMKRYGTTLVELAIVIGIMAIVTLPVATLLTEGSRTNLVALQTSRDQAAARAILDEVVHMARRATMPPDVVANSGHLSLTVPVVDRTNGQVTGNTTYDYLYSSGAGLFYKTVGSGVQTVFPDGLEKGRITVVSFSIASNVLTVTVTAGGGVAPQTTLTTQVILPNK